jgi:hypothetical protein
MFLCVPGVALAQGTFNVVGTHPDAINQSTATGKTLAALTAFNGKIYAGFGDYNSNTGPIGIRAFNPATNTFSSRLLNDQTEAVYQFRQINGKLYAPDIDPKAGESSGGYAVGTANGASETWQHKAPVTAVHMYDVAGYGGSLWMAGAQGNNAMVWRGDPNGTNWDWSVSLSVPPVRTFAPCLTASCTFLNASSAFSRSIIGPMSVAGSRGSPTCSSLTAARIFPRACS